MIRKLFLLWGAEDDGSDDDDTGKPDSSDSAPSTREVTEKDLEDMMARAADKAARKARREIASDLGFESIGSLKDFVGSKKQAEDDAQDEQTKALQEAERTKKEFEAAMADLVDQRLSLQVSQAVMTAGVSDPAKAKRIAALVRDDLDDDLSDEETWDGSITEALQSVQADMPELFAKPPVGSGDGGAHGDSTKDDDPEAAREKQLVDEYASKGFIEHTF